MSGNELKQGVTRLRAGAMGAVWWLLALTAWGEGGALPGYVGSESCRGCHGAEFEAWQGSHHDLAMQPATEDTVLGDFDDAVFEHRGVTTRFFRRDGGFRVETEGADGERREYPVDYTFGVRPLQQYLLGFPDGRYQALTVAWDSRPETEGGQRWFHLYPREEIPPGDALHWTAPVHNWNLACAECHSTGLRKHYDPADDRYATTWAEIDVACEACHGPGARHVAWARAPDQADAPVDRGLLVDLAGRGRWSLDRDRPDARQSAAPSGAPQVEACGRCHARRTQLTEDYVHGRSLSDTHRVELLSEGLYHPDGQILDEVYVYGSFRQSRMHAVGVTCSDCHEPHSLQLRAEGNALCAGCHLSTVYDRETHHHHPAGSIGAQCVECHMPARTYMVVDPRRDHSLRIPRPELSAELGVPNACSGCHAGRTDQWAIDALKRWYGDDRAPGHQRYARVLQTAREGGPGAHDGLVALVLDRSAPVIARATALQELAGRLQPGSLPAIEAGLRAEDPLLRRAAVETLAGTELAVRLPLVAPLLRDPVRGVRLAAAGVLEDVPPGEVDDPEFRAALEQAFDEYLASELVSAERAEYLVNLGRFQFQQGRIAEAEAAFAQARRRDARFVPLYLAAADMYRALGREEDGERMLRDGLEAIPEAAPIHHALGLLLVRAGRPTAALASLERAFRLGPEDPRLGYVYGVALENAGQAGQALDVWSSVVERHPNDRETLSVLATTLYRAGRPDQALRYAEHLAALTPDDQGLQRFLLRLRSAAAGPSPGAP